MRVLVLGAGRDVGRSCVVVRIGGKTLMFDCGMHLGYNKERRFPDFDLLSPDRNFTGAIDALFISHFHLDHVGALPYFTEVCGYKGPIFMTHPTRAIAPLMLQDYAKVLYARPGSDPVFLESQIEASMDKVQLMDLQETVQVCEGVHATAYYAGHVLGAAMIHVRVGCESLVYTGDFNTVPERHLGGACIERLCPDLLISESTYATTIRDNRRQRERQLLALADAAVASGGKVLVPVSAVGRAQELLILLHEHWQRTGREVPMYMSSILAVRASAYFKLLQNWASSRVKQAAPGARSAAFDFGWVQDWQPKLINSEGACVLFATPGMLQGGVSLEVFKAWAPDPRNLVLLPSYQVAGSVGRNLMKGTRKGLQLDSQTTLDVNCQMEFAALSAHADSKGILQVVQQVAPAAVLLVHGEPDKMDFMADRLRRSLGIPCFVPANGEEVQVHSGSFHAVPASAQLLRQLPAAVQQLQPAADANGAGAAGGSGAGAGVALADAAAGWLEQGDVGHLAAAAMQLAGVGRPQGVDEQRPQQPPLPGVQQQLQVHETPAAARAAQIAPWLEVLAASAQQAKHSPQRQPDLPLAAAAAPVALSRELQQQLDLEQQAVVLDGVLLVAHRTGSGGFGAQQVADGKPQMQMQLLPAEAAAAALKMQQHQVRLTCQLQVPAHIQQQGEQPSAAALVEFAASVLRSGLGPGGAAQSVAVDAAGGRVVLRSIVLQQGGEAGAALTCSWLLPDDALAQRCVALLRLAARSNPSA